MYLLFKILSLFTAFFMMLSPAQIVTGTMGESGNLPIDNSDSITEKSQVYASNMKNSVQGIYGNSDRDSYIMSNTEISLEHRLSGLVKTATLRDKNGNEYIKDSFTSFYTDKNGAKKYFETSTKTGRVNTIRLGVYYYDVHVRDFASNSFKVDKNFHVYGDKLYAQYSLMTSTQGAYVNDFGMEFTFEKSKVNSVEIKDGSGAHHDVDKIQAESVEYVAFDIKDTGIVGFIIPSDGSVSEVTVSQNSASYTVDIYASYQAGTKLNDNEGEGGYDLDAITTGCRIYTDKSHDFSGISTQTYIERNPLTTVAVSGDAYDLTYEALRGTYTYKIGGTHFQYAYDNPYFRPEALISVIGDEYDRTLYFRNYGASGCLEAAALVDSEGELMAEDVEVCKNFMGDGGESFYSYRDFQYGDAFFPICVGKNQKSKFTLVNLYQNWGNFPLKQISSIEFHVSYYHLSTGTTESNCIAPYFVYDKDGWTLPDFRGRSGNMWATQPQFNSVGILKFAKQNKSDNEIVSELSGTRIDSVGPVYSDVTDSYISDDGKYSYSLRHVEMPQTDENRTYYDMKITFNEKVTYSNFAKQFDLFYFDGRFTNYQNICYFDENDKDVSAEKNTTGKEVYHTLSKNSPYWGFYNVTEDCIPDIIKGFGCNMAMVVRKYTVSSQGLLKDINLTFKDSSSEENSYGAITLDTKEITFLPGDTIELEMILLPWGVGTEDNFDNVIAVRNDSAVNKLSIDIEKGTKVYDPLVPTVKADNNQAVFTVSGGKNNSVVKITGVTKKGDYNLRIFDGENFENYEVASECGYDGYEITLEKDGTYTYSFVYCSDGSPVTFSFDSNIKRD